MTAITFESVFQQAQQLPPSEKARLNDALTENLAEPTSATQQVMSIEERRARVEAVCGKYAYINTSVDEFLARKHEDTEREEAQYLARHPEEAQR